MNLANIKIFYFILFYCMENKRKCRQMINDDICLLFIL
jgi:hypothetical protein